MTLLARLRGATISNAGYSVLDYLSVPVLMLASAPFLLKHLGVEQYAIWVLASAAVTSGVQLSAGFGDAALKYIAAYRDESDGPSVERTVRTLLGINLALSATVSLLLACCVPLLVTHMPHLSDAMRVAYRRSLHIGCVLLVVKAVESVLVCAQRAHERYDIAARFTISARILTLGTAVVLADMGQGTVAIMISMLAFAVASVLLQALTLQRHLKAQVLLPTLQPSAVRELFSFGTFSWMQGVIGLLSGQADRFLVSYLLGTQALACYSICVQATMPIHGIAAAALQVLFPYLSARLGVLNRTILRQTIVTALTANIIIVAALALPLILGSHYILHLWMGTDFAAHASLPMSIAGASFALLGLNVTGHFVFMALGRVKILTALNAIAAAVMLALIALLSPRFGIVGASAARLAYGPIICLIYFPICRMVSRSHSLNSPHQFTEGAAT